MEPTSRASTLASSAMRQCSHHARPHPVPVQLTDTGRPGVRWEGAPPPTLERVLFHLLQEYARHVGHLDAVREQAVGQVGE